MIDVTFLLGTFVDQVSTVCVLQETVAIDATDFDCSCWDKTLFGQAKRSRNQADQVCVQYGICFSLVINSQRQSSIDAAIKAWCPQCQNPTVRLAPATLRVRPNERLTMVERRELWRQLEVEIEERIEFETRFIPTGGEES
jgi:hypothetical protein